MLYRSGTASRNSRLGATVDDLDDLSVDDLEDLSVDDLSVDDPSVHDPSDLFEECTRMCRSYA